MTKNKNSKQRILEMAQREFAAHGFAGARMERIARAADINKAMIFYYFSSKRELYRTLIKSALADLVPRIQKAVILSDTPGMFFEKVPEIYLRHFSRNPEFIRMVGFEVIRAPQNIAPLISEVFADFPNPPTRLLPRVIRTWHEQGLISESDPVDFILNIISLCVFSIIATPVVEAILDIEIPDYDAYIEQRIQSISNLLKKGMLI